jgi:hypothetical protein
MMEAMLPSEMLIGLCHITQLYDQKLALFVVTDVETFLSNISPLFTWTAFTKFADLGDRAVHGGHSLGPSYIDFQSVDSYRLVLYKEMHCDSEIWSYFISHLRSRSVQWTDIAEFYSKRQLKLTSCVFRCLLH